MGVCLSIVRRCFLKSDVSSSPPMQLVTFDGKYKGEKVSVTNFVIIGDGTALANAALHQSRAYWEVKVLEAGDFSIGVSHRLKPEHLNGQLGDNSRHSWGLRVDGNSGLLAKTGDIFSVSLDQSEIPVLHFSLNGVRLENRSIRGIRGLVFPAMSVTNGSRLDANFGPTAFVHEPPKGFAGIIRAQDIL
eukprot:g5700.t1